MPSRISAATPSFVNSSTASGKSASRTFERTSAVPDEIDRSLRVRSVGRGAPLQIRDHFGRRVARGGGHAQHHREEVAPAARGHHFAVRAVFPSAAESHARHAALLQARQTQVVIALKLEIRGRSGSYRLPQARQTVNRADGREMLGPLELAGGVFSRRLALRIAARRRPDRRADSRNLRMSLSSAIPQGKSLEYTT